MSTASYLPVAIASLWIVGFVLSTVGDPHSWRTGSRSVRLWGVGVALAVLALLAHDRNRAWATELTLWQDAVDKAPGMYRPHMHLGGAMETAGKWEAARAAYERAVEIDPSVALVRHQLGALYKASGKQEAAMTAYREGILLDPPRVESHYNLANLYFDMGKLDDSRRSYESALALQPDHRGARYNLADVYARLGQFRKAEAICLEALAEAQPDGRFHLLLAKVRESLAK